MTQDTTLTTQENNLAQMNQDLSPLVQAVMSGNIDASKLDQLEKLFDIQKAHEENEAKKAYFKALSEFKTNMPRITKNKQGHNSKYATLDHALETVTPELIRNGLSLTWRTETDNTIKVTAVLTHKQGYSETTSLSAPPEKSGSKNEIQAVGSTLSYLERYTAFALLGLASSEQDNDGASQAKEQKPDNPLIVEARLLFAEVKKAGANKEQLAELKVFMDKLDVPSFTKQSGFILAEIKDKK